MLEGALSRRDFLRSLGAGPVFLSLLGSGCGGGGRSTVEVGEGGLLLDGRLFPVLGGTLNYWQHEPGDWPALLDSLVRLGLNSVWTAVPWALHETGPGRFDFGEADPRLALGSFLKLARERSLKVMLRPGPRIGDELDCHGFPPRVVFDPELAAHTAVETLAIRHTPGGQFPLPSYYSDRFYDLLGEYFHALAGTLAGQLHPQGGPVVALEIDSGLAWYNHSRRPYSTDYHPAALALYRGWLEERYGRWIQELNRVYGTTYHSFAQVEPPRRFPVESSAGLVSCLDWAAFRQWSVRWSLERIAGLLARHGMGGVAFFLDLPGDFGASAALAGLGDAAGIALIGRSGAPGRGEYQRGAELGRELSGESALPLRTALGGGHGLEPHPIAAFPEEIEFTALAALMHGVRGLNLHHAAEGDRWTAAPIRRDGSPRPGYFESCQRILRLVRESRLHLARKDCGVVFLAGAGLERLESVACQARGCGEGPGGWSDPGAVFSEIVDYGFRTSPEACALWAGQLIDLMRKVGFDWDYSAPGSVRLSRYRAALLPALDFLGIEELASLEHYLREGGVLVFGPGAPILDGSLRAASRVQGFFAGAVPAEEYLAGFVNPYNGTRPALERKGGERGMLLRLENPLAIGDLLKALGVEPQFTRSNNLIELSLHRLEEDRLVLFAANPGAVPERTDIFFTGRRRFRVLWGEGPELEAQGSIGVELEPYGILVWEVSA